MNLTELIATTVGIIGSIGGIGTLIYWRQNKLGSTSDALSKAFDALENVTNLVDDQQEKHNKQMSQKDVVIEQLYEVIDQKTQVALDNQTKIDKLTREWQERDYEFATMKRQLKGMQTIIDNFEARAKHAENGYCEIAECKLRVPKIGTYKPK
ncbi:MAG: hypothetical protein PHI32_15375 [Dysgonamonadaceae bacterium]|nr:hypothetical protein [Dysgonamonadaceae bacterium]